MRKRHVKKAVKKLREGRPLTERERAVAEPIARFEDALWEALRAIKEWFGLRG